MNKSEAAVTLVKEKSAAIDESSVEHKTRWKMIFPERGKIPFRAGHEKMG
jgi:hypothetical protein